MEPMLDGSVYPDREGVPDTLDSDEDKADYVARVCGAWDFGLVPTPTTFALFAEWRAVFDRFPLIHSPAYAAFRMTYGWPAVPVTILEAPWEAWDRRHGRSLPDPCAESV
jgi:hypothetical protein